MPALTYANHMTNNDTPWLNFLAEVERQLLIQADYLLEREKRERLHSDMVDYGFLVYPAAKAYEGFLKTFLYRNRLITSEMYQSEQFRIGKALNPDLPVRYREDGWVWDDLARLYGEDVPQRFWSTWRKCRNHVFHFRPDKLRLYTLVEAQIKIELIFSTIALAINREQQMSYNNPHHYIDEENKT